MIKSAGVTYEYIQIYFNFEIDKLQKWVD